MTSAIAIAGVSRTEGVMRAGTKAVERIRQLELEAEGAFAELYTAQEACAREGIAFAVELGPGIACAYAEWKQRRATAEARAIAREDGQR